MTTASINRQLAELHARFSELNQRHFIALPASPAQAGDDSHTAYLPLSQAREHELILIAEEIERLYLLRSIRHARNYSLNNGNPLL